MVPKLRNVIRLDSVPLDQAFFTPEGFMIDRPVVTSTGIFEYLESDGSIRRELRLPEDVFDPNSLKSYEGKPIIITHDAGLVTKDNVHTVQIGTILTEGYRSGNNVKAKIIIHDTDEMKECGLKELSLGYNLDLDETPGEWNGQHYDAIQKNIRINHLALVREARAGEQARLNLDGRDSILKGGKVMGRVKKTSHGDSILSQEELAKAIEEYKARRAQEEGQKTDAEEEKKVEAPVVEEPKTVPVVAEAEKKAAEAKEERENKEPVPAPQTMDDAAEVIKSQDEDIATLFDIIDTLLAERDFKAAAPAEPEKKDEGEEVEEEAAPVVEENHDEDEEEIYTGEQENTDEDDEEEETPVFAQDEDDEEEAFAEDDFDDDIPSTDVKEAKEAPGQSINTDSVDKIVRTRIKLGLIGNKLNMDGLENMNIMKAKKTIIKAVRPSVRLDGKTTQYIDTMYDLVCDEIETRSRKDTRYQKKQMFNKDSKRAFVSGNTSDMARQRMIERRMNKKEDK